MEKNLLVFTAIFEGATGVALLVMPAMFASLLLGASLDGPGAVTVAHVAGAALLSIALMCWLARDDGQTRTGRAVIAGLVVYNLAVAAVLVHAGLVLGITGIGLWPAVGAHGVLSVWCFASLRRQ